MNQGEMESLARSIISELMDKEITLKEARLVMNMVDSKIRKSSAILSNRWDNAPLKEILREAYGQDSSA